MALLRLYIDPMRQIKISGGICMKNNSQHRSCCGWQISVGNSFSQSIPNMFNWVSIRRASRLVHYFHPIFFETILYNVNTMRSSIIV